jgi:hypothetical protein
MFGVLGVPRLEGFRVFTLGESGSTITLKFAAGVAGASGKVCVETLGKLLVPEAGDVPAVGADVPVVRDAGAPGAQHPLAQPAPPLP